MRSIFHQLPGAKALPQDKLLRSPRHWNCGLQWHNGKLWVAYRYHFSPEDPRSAIAMCEIDPKTLEVKGKSQHIDLERPTLIEHHEDPRLFLHGGNLHMSYNEVIHVGGAEGFICVVKYCRLKKTNRYWQIEHTWQPVFGRNNGMAKEKNWGFFSDGQAIHAVYCDSPRHVVIRLDGDQVVDQWESIKAFWPFGEIRGGAPPFDLGNGQMLNLFHSSIATEEAPHYLRYVTGCYSFDAKPPFAIRQIMVKPLAWGSEMDQHREDPRKPLDKDGRKPFVTFPCGIVQTADMSWLISMGINDWQAVIAPVDAFVSRQWIKSDGSDYRPRYFKATNSSLPIRYPVLDGNYIRTEYLNWERPELGGQTMVAPGYFRATDERIAETLVVLRGVVEVSETDYLRAFGLALREA